MITYGFYKYKICFSMTPCTENGRYAGYTYEIYSLNEKMELIVKSEEWFDSQMEANYAAIGHISFLEQQRES